MGLFAGIGLMMSIFIILCVCFLWFIALVDILRSDFRGNDKVVWVIVVIFFPFLGSILYFLIGRSKKIR
ncbi:MAG: PLDc N-terminal domain-containing protein [Chitinophagales bacterium]